jgi:hypothetical protein
VRLTARLKRQILLNNLFGVDIDPQAVEVTRLSLSLKALEDTRRDELYDERTLFKQTVLPDLSGNVKCGNSLIGPDYFAGRIFPDADELRRVNPFDWQREFSEAMTVGGFDAIIGNPPYLFGENLTALVKSYYAAEYRCAIGQYDTYWLFAEKALNLTRPGGYFSMIVPDALLARDEVAVIRKLLLENGLTSLYHCAQVFRGVGVSAVVYLGKKGKKTDRVGIFVPGTEAAELLHECDGAAFARDPLSRFTIYASVPQQAVLAKMDAKSQHFGGLVVVSRGEETGKSSVSRVGEIPILVGEDVSRYHILPPSRYVEALLKPKQYYRAPKIVMVKTGRTIVAALDVHGFGTMQSLYNIQLREDCKLSPAYLLGLMNSTLISFVATRRFTAYKKLFPQFNQSTVEQLPIRTINFTDPADVARHDRMVQLVEAMLALHRHKAAARTQAEQDLYQRQIEVTDRQIDALVYELYGLTADEIAIVEGQG